MAELLLEAATGLVIAVVLVAICGWLLDGLAAWRTPQRHLLRESRRHAEQTARAMRRMTAIRRETARQMDEAERRWRP